MKIELEILWKALVMDIMPIAVAARSKAWVYGRQLAGIAGSNSAGRMVVCLL
jgi:hypothetical protein